MPSIDVERSAELQTGQLTGPGIPADIHRLAPTVGLHVLHWFSGGIRAASVANFRNPLETERLDAARVAFADLLRLSAYLGARL